jgi:hypothetical protein
MIVLPGGGYAAHAPHEAEPVASWLGEMGVQASVFAIRSTSGTRRRWTRCALRSAVGEPQVHSASGSSGSPPEAI